jgi:hypothetical protein
MRGNRILDLIVAIGTSVVVYPYRNLPTSIIATISVMVNGFGLFKNNRFTFFATEFTITVTAGEFDCLASVHSVKLKSTLLDTFHDVYTLKVSHLEVAYMRLALLAMRENR